MSSDRRKNRLLFDNDIEDIENMKTIYEFQVRISRDSTEYESPEFLLQDTDLRCCVKLKKENTYYISFSLHIKDDFNNFCDKKPRFEEILWFNEERNYNVNVTINEENPTLPLFFTSECMNYICKLTISYRIKNYDSISDENLTMSSNLQNMYEDEEFTDVIINVEGEEFSAHKVLLNKNPVFAEMLRNDMRESKENIIYIKESDPAVFQIILRYLYLGNTGKINFKKLGEDFLINLIVATHKYKMEYLNTELINIATKYMNLMNVIQLFILADRYNILELKQKIMLNIKKHREKILDSLPFKELIKENLKLTGELLLYVMQK